MGDKRILPAAAAQFVMACSFSALYYMVTLAQHRSGWFFPNVLLVYGPLIYSLDRLFLRREPTLRALYGVNGAAVLLILGVYLWVEPWRSGTYLFFAALFFLWLTINGCRLALNGADLRGCLLGLDASAAVLVLFAGWTAAMGGELVVALPAAAGFLAAVVGVIACRSGAGMGWRAWLVMVGSLLAILLGVLVFVGVAASAAGAGVVTLSGGLAAAFREAGAALLQGLKTLLTLLPAAESQEIPQYEAPDSGWIGEAATEENPVSGLVLAAVLLVLMTGVAVWIIRKLGKIRAVQYAVSEELPQRRKRVPLRLGLGTLFQAWVVRLRRKVWLWKERNTPKGLYFILVHRCQRGSWRKGTGETPREFLVRLARDAQEDPVLESALLRLAVETDAAFYAPNTPQVTLEEGKLIRCRLGRAVRRRLLRERLARRKQNPM